MTALKNSVVLVTGGNRGIGKALVEEAYARGARKVWAAARDPRKITHPDAAPLALDVTDPAAVAAAAQAAGDVTVLVNNAGVAHRAGILDGPLDDVRRDFDVNFYGPLYMARAFAPVLERNGGGHLLNVLSVVSWLAEGTSYGASKAAAWSQTNSLRLALRPRGIHVTGLHMGYVDTDMTANLDVPKVTAQDVAAAAFDGVESDADEVLADDTTRWVKSALSGELAAMYAQFGL
ncbi:MAG TPA: SDR family oxidoreductase [Streptomyces sp.]